MNYKVDHSIKQTFLVLKEILNSYFSPLHSWRFNEVNAKSFFRVIPWTWRLHVGDRPFLG